MTDSNPAPPLSAAPIEWRDGIPVSLNFDDVYYSLDNGLQETAYVFLQQNQLQQRWETLDQNGGHFTIAETGFGSGLNFLAACDLWLKTAPENWCLNFISTELYPLKPDDLTQALQQWPQLKDFAKELLNQYPAIVPGTHQLHFANGRINLTLLFGEATEMLSKIGSSPDYPLASHAIQGVDAWFLDGFAPAKNPQMWTPELFATMSSLSRAGTTFATFTAAGIVRRGLTEVGFTVKKVPGFGRKREMLCGQKTEEISDNIPDSLTELPWYLDQRHLDQQRPRKTPTNHLNKPAANMPITILGAGIAGCTTAVALKKRGFDVTVIDRHPQAGQEGSGNPQGIVYPKLSPRNDQLPRINLAALLFASRYYQPFWHQGLGEQSGILVIPENEKATRDFQKIAERFTGNEELVRALDQAGIDDICGLRLNADQGLFFPNLGWLPPSRLCQRLLEIHQIPLLQADIQDLRYRADNNTWQLLGNSGTPATETERLVIANAYGATQFEQTNHLPARRIQGQISQLPATDESTKLKTVICGEGYITPAFEGLHSCGATYNKDLQSTNLRTEDHQSNLQQIHNTNPALRETLGQPDVLTMQGRANFRCTTPDYLPIVGQVPDVTAMLDSFSFLRRDARKTTPVLGNYLPNLYINIGMGSRGLSYAPLTAEILASEIAGEVPPLERELRLAMHPARFLIRDLKRNKI